MQQDRRISTGRREYDGPIETLVEKFQEQIQDVKDRYNFGIFGFLAGVILPLSLSIYFPATIYTSVIRDGVEVARPVAPYIAILAGIISVMLMVAARWIPSSKWAILSMVVGSTNLFYWSIVITLTSENSYKDLQSLGSGVLGSAIILGCLSIGLSPKASNGSEPLPVGSRFVGD